MPGFTLKKRCSPSYWLLIFSAVLLTRCGEYEYARAGYPNYTTAVTLPGMMPSPSFADMPCKPAAPLPPPSIIQWNSNCFVDATALNDMPCTQQIIAGVLALNQPIIREIRRCFGGTKEIRIKFEVDSSLVHGMYGPVSRCILKTGPSDTADRIVDSSAVSIRITLNPYHLAASTRLSVAASIIHEMLHAYFFFRCADAAGDPVKEQRLAKELPLLKPFHLYKKYVAGNHHEQMAQKYIGQIAAALKEFQLITEKDMQPLQKYSKTLDVEDYYKAMAWAGLTGSQNGDITTAWTSFKKARPGRADAYEIIISAEHNCTVLSASKDKCGR